MKTPVAILKESVDHFREFASTYLGYSAWILVPILGLVLLEFLPKNVALTTMALVLIISSIFIIVWVSIILIILAVELDKKETPDFKEIQVRSMRLIAPLLWVAFLQFLLFIGGAIFFLIPLFLFVVWYAFAQVSVILDNKRGTDAFSHSRALTRGRYWYTAWGMVGIPALIGLVYALFVGAVVYLVASVTGQDVAAMFTAEEQPILITLVDALAQLFVMPIFAIYTVRFYLHMKMTHKSPELEKSCDVS